MEELSADRKAEVEKLARYLKQMESIVRTSSNPDQVQRVKKEIAKQREKIKTLWSGYNPEKMSPDDVLSTIVASGAGDSSSAGRGDDGPDSLIDALPEHKVSPHSTDPDVNLLSKVLNAIQKEYWPAISEQHTKLDFSLSQERDSIRYLLDTALRNMKILGETVDEYAQAEKQDFREQLLKMKSKQSRVFLFETDEALRTVREFLRKLLENMQSKQGGILNPDEKIRFNERFEDATFLEGVSVPDAIERFHTLVNETIQRLNLPQVKSND